MPAMACSRTPKWKFRPSPVAPSKLPKVFKGAHVGNPEVEVRHATEVRIAADRPFALYADGDPIADLPATVRTLPGAVRVLAP